MRLAAPSAPVGRCLPPGRGVLPAEERTLQVADGRNTPRAGRGRSPNGPTHGPTEAAHSRAAVSRKERQLRSVRAPLSQWTMSESTDRSRADSCFVTGMRESPAPAPHERWSSTAQASGISAGLSQPGECGSAYWRQSARHRSTSPRLSSATVSPFLRLVRVGIDRARSGGPRRRRRGMPCRLAMWRQRRRALSARCCRRAAHLEVG